MAESGGLSKAQLRKAFTADVAPVIASQVCESCESWTTSMGLSTFFAWFHTGDQLILVGRPGENQRDLDLGLAFGVAHAGDRELVLVLPAGSEEPTRRRLPWLDVPVAVWTFTDSTPPVRSPPLTRHEVLESCDDALVTAVHSLGDRTRWVDRLTSWADSSPELVRAHRISYLAWHCRGRLVLKVMKRKRGLTLTAGVHSKDPLPETVAVTGDISAEHYHRLTSAASWAIADRLGGQDTGHAEHQLQERLAEVCSGIGLLSTVREFPASRPVDNRGFIDLLGVGEDGAIHVVETKIGADAMLVLQGLDYWTWATAHREELSAHLSSTLRVPLPAKPRIVLDFVLAETAGLLLAPYTAAQLEALDGSIPWQVHRIDAWDTDEPRFTSFGRRKVPPEHPRAAAPRYAVRIQPALVELAGAALAKGVFFAEGAGIIEPAQPAYVQLRDQNLLHGFVDHVRSSQALALNLFGGLDHDEALALWGLINPDVTTHDGMTLEYVDPQDDLAELQTKRPHQTQVDVLLRGRTARGARHVTLIEVKLSETRFGHCSAFDSPDNDRRHVCHQPAPWGGDTDACYQLRNHGGPHRRRYDVFLAPAVRNAGAPGCVFRELNQPMRNAALARALIDRDEADAATFALCAPADNSHVWRQWTQAEETFRDVPDVTLGRLRVEDVIAVLGPSRRTAVQSRYGFPVT